MSTTDIYYDAFLSLEFTLTLLDSLRSTGTKIGENMPDYAKFQKPDLWSGQPMYDRASTVRMYMYSALGAQRGRSLTCFQLTFRCGEKCFLLTTGDVAQTGARMVCIHEAQGCFSTACWLLGLHSNRVQPPYTVLEAINTPLLGPVKRYKNRSQGPYTTT
jgi:hypothetical protein